MRAPPHVGAATESKSSRQPSTQLAGSQQVQLVQQHLRHQLLRVRRVRHSQSPGRPKRRAFRHPTSAHVDHHLSTAARFSERVLLPTNIARIGRLGGASFFVGPALHTKTQRSLLRPRCASCSCSVEHEHRCCASPRGGLLRSAAGTPPSRASTPTPADSIHCIVLHNETKGNQSVRAKPKTRARRATRLVVRGSSHERRHSLRGTDGHHSRRLLSVPQRPGQLKLAIAIHLVGMRGCPTHHTLGVRTNESGIGFFFTCLATTFLSILSAAWTRAVAKCIKQPLRSPPLPSTTRKGRLNHGTLPFSSCS